MPKTTLFMNGRSQAGKEVSIRWVGDGVLLEPVVGAGGWPPGYFEAIRIDDEGFARPPQGDLPAVPSRASKGCGGRIGRPTTDGNGRTRLVHKRGLAFCKRKLPRRRSFLGIPG